jgi:hypothetical protein
MQEEKHFEDTYLKNHALKNKAPEAPPVKKVKTFGYVEPDN